jgi:UDP-N-acetylmuramate dehydrogenase
MSLAILEHVDLDARNTLRLPCQARYWAAPASEAELEQVLTDPLLAQWPLVILGGGSNVLLPPRLDALVVQPALRGIQLLAQEGTQCVVEVMAGEPWPALVAYTLAQGWYGLENLSLIPGSAGAAPVQNIGAYGLEVAERLEAVHAWSVPEQRWHWLTPAQSRFGYRDSRFKQEAGQWVISRVRFRLSTEPDLRLGYGDVRREAGAQPTPQSVAEAVIRIRRSKLPDPAERPNAGSFFKNPLVSAAQFASLQAHHPGLVGHVQPDGQVKLAAGWLIDQAGWKGRGLGPVKMHDLQALVMVNTGGATLADVQALTRAVQQSVQARYGVSLEPEPIPLNPSR